MCIKIPTQLRYVYKDRGLGAKYSVYEDPIAVKDLIEEINVIRGFNQDQLDEVVHSGLNIGGVLYFWWGALLLATNLLNTCI